MRLQLAKRWDDLRSSYWFIPSVMTAAAFGLSFATTTLDSRMEDGWIQGLSWLYANKPEGARTLLSTVAGSMIGVAGVTFSITIASVVYASGQYGPRLLTNFMRDTGNQVTLGTFIATFVYCLLVLRTIRSSDESVDGPLPDDFVGAFVPHIALIVGLALSVASIAVLIYFIHHVPDSIRVSHVIAGVGHELDEQISDYFPEKDGALDIEDDPEAALPEGFYDDVAFVTATADGYIQSFDDDGLVALASEHGLLLRIKMRPGDFVSKGDVLLLVHPAEGATEHVIDRVRESYTHGRARSALQDVRFLFAELVEIAARALSPGVNDPFTAINCLGRDRQPRQEPTTGRRVGARGARARASVRGGVDPRDRPGPRAAPRERGAEPLA